MGTKSSNVRDHYRIGDDAHRFVFNAHFVARGSMTKKYVHLKFSVRLSARIRETYAHENHLERWARQRAVVDSDDSEEDDARDANSSGADKSDDDSFVIALSDFSESDEEKVEDSTAPLAHQRARIADSNDDDDRILPPP